jgi:hypothetical protein
MTGLDTYESSTRSGKNFFTGTTSPCNQTRPTRELSAVTSSRTRSEDSSEQSVTALWPGGDKLWGSWKVPGEPLVTAINYGKTDMTGWYYVGRPEESMRHPNELWP